MSKIPMSTWLGESNGQSILYEILMSDVTKEQARAAVTTYCILFDIIVDTNRWDNLIQVIWDYYNSWFDSKEELDNYMCGLLV